MLIQQLQLGTLRTEPFDDSMSRTDVVLFKVQFKATDATTVTRSNMSTQLTEFVLVDTSYLIDVIQTVPTVCSHVITSQKMLVNETAMKRDPSSDRTR